MKKPPTGGLPVMTTIAHVQPLQQNLLSGLLTGIRHLVTRFVLLPGPEYADAVTLWIAHAHAITAATTSPRLVFKSAEKASGKTRALEVLECLVPAPLATVNATIAAVFRLLAEEQATLLFDEVDSIFNPKAAGQHEDLRALLNAGHRKGATVVRVVGEGKKMSVQRFPVFAATALAAIGNLPETIESRAIIVPMRRRAPDEPVEPFRLRKVVAETDTLRAGLARWAELSQEELTELEPQMPEGINDRLGDSWEPLLAIAELAGNEWTNRARAAAARIAGGHVLDEASVGVQLLADVRICLDGADRLSTVNLLAKLNGMEEAQWGGWNERGMAARDLARRLKPFDIKSRTIRLPDSSTAKGYLREDFVDAWTRYLPPSVQASQASQASHERIPVTDVADVTAPRRGEGTSPNGVHDWPDNADLLSLTAVGAPMDEESTAP